MEPELAEAYEGQKWEYHLEFKMMNVGNKNWAGDTNLRLVELGEAGWELVQIQNSMGVFKRPLN
jgi:hypothetical protein